MAELDQWRALATVRGILAAELQLAMVDGKADSWGSPRVPHLWEAIEDLTRAFPAIFGDLNNPLDQLAEGC